MNLSSAKNLINETFKHKFDEDQFKEFLTELFINPNLEWKNQLNFVGKGFLEYVNQVFTLGHYRDEYGDNIRFYVVELKKKTSRDRARTMQRNLIAKLMKNQHAVAALVAFYEPDSDDWRFSYVKLEYEFTTEGIKEKLSSAKRHSFLVGPNEPNNTCYSQFKKLLTTDDKITLDEIEEAFSIENVTKEFFDKYKSLFMDLKESIDGLIEDDGDIFNEFNLKKIKSVDFAKKLMGQLVFIYFLQKKGWLGVDKNAEWGSGPKDFINQLFDKEFGEYDNFFNDVLEPLLYIQLSGHKNK